MLVNFFEWKKLCFRGKQIVKCQKTGWIAPYYSMSLGMPYLIAYEYCTNTECYPGNQLWRQSVS